MFDTSQHYCVCYVVTLLCLSPCNITMFINMWRKGYECHIATIWVCFSHYDDGAMFVTMWQYGYVRHIAMIRLCLTHCDITMFVRLWHYYARHIATLLRSSLCDEKTMFVTLRQYAYVHHITMMRLCFSHWDDRPMFDTLRHCYVY